MVVKTLWSFKTLVSIYHSSWCNIQLRLKSSCCKSAVLTLLSIKSILLMEVISLIWFIIWHRVSSMMFYDAISCWDDKVWVIEDGMSMERLWNRTDRGEQKSSGKNLYHCQCVLHKFNMVWPGSEAAPPHWETMAQPTDVELHGLFTALIYIDSLKD